ncbi:MAG: 3-dehydroquinate synthase [Pyrinomonadaceae bacterium]
MHKGINEIQISSSSQDYNVRIGNELLPTVGDDLRSLVGAGVRCVHLISNEIVAPIYSAEIRNTLLAADFQVSETVLPDGEEFKNLSSFARIINDLANAKIDRSSILIALGGGVIGDLTGFAAAAFLRGIKFYQIPTTLLSMVDSSVGGKTGVNIKSGKNMVGAFHSPIGVTADVATLATLDARDTRAGFYEIVKHAIIGGEALFTQTSNFLARFSPEMALSVKENEEFATRLIELITANIAFKAEVVSNDEREDISRTDARTRKILNFGHTVAHAIERETNYEVFRHGEAVGYGILAAAALSKKLELLDADSLQSLNDVVASVGKLQKLADIISSEKIIEALNSDKKVIQGELQWVLLNGIGKPVIVPNSSIPSSVLQESIEQIISR